MKRTVLGIMLFLVTFLFLFGCTTSPRVTAAGTGQITFEVYDEDGVIVATREVTFHQGNTLVELLQGEFVIYCNDSEGNSTQSCDFIEPYGVYLMGIDDLIPENGAYLALYVNGEFASTGLDFLDIVDGYVYQFKYETY